MKVAIGQILSGGYRETVPAAFFRSFNVFKSALHRGEVNAALPRHLQVTECPTIESTKFPMDVARNDICRAALAEGCDALLFLDIDQSFEPDVLTRLLSHEKDIVTGRYHVKRPPYHPNLYVTPRGPHRDGDFRPVHYGRGLFPIDRCGAGALLISRTALEAVGFPWFRYTEDPSTQDLQVSEDFYFCRRAQEAGFTLWADWDCELGHIMQGTVTGEWYDEYLRSMERGIAAGQTDLVDSLVVCGYEDGYTLPSGQVVPPYQAPVVA